MRSARSHIAVLALASLAIAVACGVAERPGELQGDGGNSNTDAGGVFECEGSCTPSQLEFEAYAASGNEEELFAVVQPLGPLRTGQLIRVNLADLSSRVVMDLPTQDPARSGLLWDQGSLYWSDSLDQNADVARINPDSAELEIIASEQVRPSTAVANTSSVYWGVRGGIMRMDKGTKVVERVHDFDPAERVDWIAADDNEILYASDTFAYRLRIVDGIPLGSRYQIIQTTRPVALREGRLYYEIPATLSGGSNDALMSMPSVGGQAQVEAEASTMDSPAVLDNGDLMWFSYESSTPILVRLRVNGEREVREILGPVGGLRWLSAQETSVSWLAGTILSVLRSQDCECAP